MRGLLIIIVLMLMAMAVGAVYYVATFRLPGEGDARIQLFEDYYLFVHNAQDVGISDDRVIVVPGRIGLIDIAERERLVSGKRTASDGVESWFILNTSGRSVREFSNARELEVHLQKHYGIVQLELVSIEQWVAEQSSGEHLIK